MGNPAEETYRYPNQIFTTKLGRPLCLSTSYSVSTKVRVGGFISFTPTGKPAVPFNFAIHRPTQSHLFQSLYFTVNGFSLQSRHGRAQIQQTL